jgi:2-polyprenyl-6-methoxyphenol hydroxylase-like FAD-dependent oxidoreductase
MYDASVMIVGAGPTGLTLALDLARRGINFRLIETAATPFTGSRGKGIQPRTLEIFEDLGVIDSIIEWGGLYPRLRIHLGPFSFRAGSLGSSRQPTEGIPYPNLWMVPQARTEAILRERLQVLGGQVEFGTALTTFTQDQCGVQAALSNGESVHAEFLVGCDGGRSTVRKGLGLRLQGDGLDEKTSVVADAEIPDLNPSDWHIWPLAKGGVVGLCPLPGTSLFQFGSRAETVATGIGEAVRQATGHMVTRVAWSSTYQSAVRMVDRYRVGRVLFGRRRSSRASTGRRAGT